MHKYITLSTTLVLVALAGCVSNPTVPALEDGEPYVAELELRPPHLTEVDDLDGTSTRVIIRARQPINPNRQGKEQLVGRLHEALDKELGKLSISIVDRDLNTRLKGEVTLASIYGSEAGRDNADALVLVVVDEYETHTSSETKTKLLKKAMGKDESYAKCTYGTQLSGYFRIQTIPQLTQLAQFDFASKDSDSFDAPNERACGKDFAAHIRKLDKKLLDHVVCKNKGKIANILAPTGHVIGRGVEGDKITLEVSLGSDMGVRKGDVLHLFHELSGEHYGEVKVTRSYAGQAQGVLTSLDKGAAIYEGDFVRPYHRNLSEILKVNCLL